MLDAVAGAQVSSAGYAGLHPPSPPVENKRRVKWGGGGGGYKNEMRCLWGKMQKQWCWTQQRTREGEKVAVHLILQCGKLLKNVSQLVSLPSTVVSVDLDQTTEWLWGE